MMMGRIVEELALVAFGADGVRLIDRETVIDKVNPTLVPKKPTRQRKAAS